MSLVLEQANYAALSRLLLRPRCRTHQLSAHCNPARTSGFASGSLVERASTLPFESPLGQMIHPAGLH
jgi:hypothetical protein